MKQFKFLQKSHHSLRSEMLIACFAISIIPIIAMQTIFYNLSQYYMEQKINTLTNNNMSYIKTNIESDLGYYKEILFRMVADDHIIDNAVKVNDGNDFERESYGIKLRDLLASYADIREEVTGITYVNSSLKSVFYDKKLMSGKNYFWGSYSNQEQKNIYDTIQNSHSVVFFNTKRYNYYNEVNYVYNIGIKAWNVNTKENLGIFIISIDEKHLQDICSIGTRNEGNNSVKEYSFIVDDKGSIVSFIDKNYIGTYLKKDAGKNSYNVQNILKSMPLNPKDGVIMNSIPISDTNWSIINLVDRSSMFYETNALWKLTLEITLGIIILCAAFIITFSNKFYKSVNDIVNEIKKAKKGDFSAHIKVKGERELIFISNEFNDMVLKINGLVENLKKQNDYIYEISNKRREAEINAIVAQINPHFLYNTLDCINWISIKNEDYEISEMIGDLADILRYSIPTINEQATIYEVVEWLKKYLYLHKVRFNNSFQVNFDVDNEILGCKIYKLLLQPIVENAVIHGFKGCTSGKLLTITINKFEQNSLKIEIDDNGAGIPKEKLDGIFDNGSSKGIGIKNVYERLKIYYKDSADMKIWSDESIGTRVTIVIPIVY
ncbi:MAG TPA: histidine kinase [Oscillospiraceae bacterium]|nr:histidine kinase [Oscillospiraceae bacterium]